MQVKCEDIIKLPILKNIKIIAGKKGLGRIVDWVNIVDSPEVISQLQKGNLVYVTDLGINKNINLIKSIINEMVTNNLSGMVISRESSKKITPEVLNIANLLSFPIFELHNEDNIIDITKNICSFILLKQEMEKSLSDLLQLLLFSCYKSNQEFINSAAYHGYDLTTPIQVMIVELEKLNSSQTNGTIKSNTVSEQSWNTAKHYISSTLNDHNIKSISTQMKDYIISLLLDTEKFCKNQIEEVLIKTNNKLFHDLPELSIYMGVGNTCNLHDIKKSYKQAEIALNVAKDIQEKNNLLFYEKIGVQRLIYNIDDHDELKSFYIDMLGPLLEYDKINNTDFVKTLDVYLSESNLNETAKILHIHINTLKYRLKRIEEILEKDIKFPCNIISLKLAFFIEGSSLLK